MKRILVIDDEPLIRSMLKKMLERQGYLVILASDGSEGVKLFKRDPTDLIITDIIMPEKEGLEIIQEIRIESLEVPIFAISGGGRNSPAEYLDLAKLLGANEIFNKPFNKNEFLGAVKRALQLLPMKPKSSQDKLLKQHKI